MCNQTSEICSRYSTSTKLSISFLTNVTWETAASSRVEGKYGDVVAHYIGRVQFVANKRAIGRKKDLADLEALGEE